MYIAYRKKLNGKMQYTELQNFFFFFKNKH